MSEDKTITVFANITDKVNPHFVSSESIIERIKSGIDKQLIDKIRNEKDGKKRAELKGQLPCICWSGKFTERNDKGIIEHSGFACLDFDHVADVLDKKVEMSYQPFVYAAFVSPSGDGVKVIVRIPKDITKHRGYYNALLKLFPEADAVNINESRVCYSSFDAMLHYNADAVEFADYLPELKPTIEIKQPIANAIEIKATGTDYRKIDVAVNMVRNAPDGEKHNTLLKSAKLVGGYVASGMVEENEAVRILENEIQNKNIDDLDSAKKCIADGIAYGKKIPITEPTLSFSKNSQVKLPVGDVLTKYDYLRISESKPIEMPSATVTAYGGIHICTPRSITTLSGQSKGGKSAISSVLLSDCIKTSNGFDGCENLTVANNTESKAVIHIDTEQSVYHHYRNFKHGVLARARIEKEPEYFYSYNIRQLNLPEYKPFVEQIFEAAFSKHDGIHLSIIDGVADFINSVNDEEEANAIVSFFEQLAIKYDTAIILILHLNPGSDKERGHLGSQLQRKSESVLTIKKEGDISVLEAKLLRSGANGDFPPISYQFDKAKGYHTFFDTVTIPDKATNLKQLAQFIFTEPKCFGDAVNLIMEYKGISKRKASDLLSKIDKAGLTEKTKDGRSVFYQLRANEPF